MADIKITTLKDFVSVPVITAGAGGVVSYMGGDVIGGMIAETLGIPETDIWGDAVCRGLSKLGIGAGGAILATKTTGGLANAGLGMAIVGFTGFFTDLVEGAIKARAPTARTGSALSSWGHGVVRKAKRLPVLGQRLVPTGQGHPESVILGKSAPHGYVYAVVPGETRGPVLAQPIELTPGPGPIFQTGQVWDPSRMIKKEAWY